MTFWLWNSTRKRFIIKLWLVKTKNAREHELSVDFTDSWWDKALYTIRPAIPCARLQLIHFKVLYRAHFNKSRLSEILTYSESEFNIWHILILWKSSEQSSISLWLKDVMFFLKKLDTYRILGWTVFNVRPYITPPSQPSRHVLHSPVAPNQRVCVLFDLAYFTLTTCTTHYSTHPYIHLHRWHWFLHPIYFFSFL